MQPVSFKHIVKLSLRRDMGLLCTATTATTTTFVMHAGEKFDVKEFHEVVLQCGSVPLTVLESCVNKMIERMK